ncbi:hypothetical protein [Actinoplanes sp. N902-109]|uniref:hypothetical protein n=1 Tax=Actinoplanes sp. (strain N902-109) TaxID=649831 RepID=UPI0003293455|nr:hypothetical protein [Actinoplanes sp. N902-109]AGL18389.1 hypothetical protein L083_4879 [Actinoplanes sp. N902-109]
MFRLIQLHAQHGVPRIGVDPDGYGSERAALARYRETPATYFGVGRFDESGRLAEIIMDSECGSGSGCAHPAVLVHAGTFRPMCDTCSFGLDTLSVAELSMQLGVAVRLAPVLAPSGRHAAPDDSCAATNRIARELAGHVEDPVWRMELCSELSRTPGAVNGLLIGVGALSHRDVLDLYPALCALGSQLPVAVHGDLVRATARPLSPAGVAALRLGL